MILTPYAIFNRAKITVLVILAMVLQAGAVGAVSIDKADKKGNGNQKSLTEKNAEELPPKEVWNRTYGADGFNAIYQTTDGGFVLASSKEPGGARIVKLDKNANTQWENDYITPKSGSHVFWDAQQTSDGGYIGVGTADEFGYTVKTDSQGNEVWNKTFKIRGNGTTAWSVVEASNGYVISGSTYYRAFIMKIDDNGNIDWSKSLGDENSYFQGLTKASNGYIASGRINYGGSNEEDGWLVKFDTSGNVVWNKTIDGSNIRIKAITDGDNGNYAFTGAGNAGNDRLFFGLVDGSGNIQWNNSINGQDDEEGLDIINTDKGYAIAGYTYSYGVNTPDKSNFWLVGIDSNGNERWNTTFGGSNFEVADGIVKDGDNFYIAGLTNSYGGSGENNWLVKAGPPKPPTAKFKYSPKNPKVSDSIKFNASMSSDPNGDSLSYEWDFGDGNTSTGEKVSHSYGSSGKYTVELTVKDGNGASDKMNMTVNVTSSKLSIEEAIANLKSENDIVNFSELQSAINFWIQRREVPGTGGKKIDFSKLQDLISLWVQEKVV